MNTKYLSRTAIVKKIIKHCWEVDHNVSCNQKKFVDRKSRLIPVKTKETTHYLNNRILY